MSTKGKNLLRVGLAVALLVGAILACCPTPAAGAVSVTITSPGDGGTVVLGQAVMIDSTVTAAAGVVRVELSVGGVVVRHDVPPSGNPTTFRLSQPWTPETEGQATISVVGYDVNGASGQATITLQVMASGAVLPTATMATAVPGGPTETPPPPVTTEAGCTLDSQYIADVTIPDGTIMTLGAGFVKTWKVKNSGTCDWETGFQLVFVSGAHMGGPPSVALPAVPAGGQTDVSVNLTAPTAYGTHKGMWRIRSTDGDVFGTNLTVVINIPAPAIDTPLPTDVPTDVPTSAAPYTEYVTKKVDIAAGATGAAIATCPDTAVVVGGGYAADPDVTFYAHSKFENGWRGDAKNNGVGNRQITVYAVCLHNVPGASVTQAYAKVKVPMGGFGQALATCPAGSIVTGGGFSVDADGSLQVYSSFRTVSAEGWQTWAKNHTGLSQTLRSFATCLSGTGGTTRDHREGLHIRRLPRTLVRLLWGKFTRHRRRVLRAICNPRL